MSTETNPPQGGLAFRGEYLLDELQQRGEDLRRALAEKRAECLRLEGQIGEVNYWLSLVRNAQPADGGDGAQGRTVTDESRGGR